MKLVEVWNYDNRYETVRIDQIQSVLKPTGRLNEHGGLVLVTGRRIAFGQDGEAEKVIRVMKAAPEAERRE